MAKEFSAIASISDAGEPQISAEQAYADMVAFMDAHICGDVIPDAEIGTVINALTAIGSDEVSVSDDGALQGNGKIKYSKSGAGIDVDVETILECKGVWDRNRMEWYYDMALNKTGGDAIIKDLVYNFRFISFGTGVKGDFKILTNYSYSVKVDDQERIAEFQNNGKIDVARIDISTNAQWGYCMIATCVISTSEGTLSI